ncbi:myosin-G heavy chain-like isoform X2 [Tetranychus urticae]|uniref:myosin-G heavy chain-like isoform X2 n=1 Tax=Tetranychus urticae TaxID=32264 RepID=UPI00077BB6D6|nr:myosin-G heavy chain-like isoform X2 [Tetranychus urticae]
MDDLKVTMGFDGDHDEISRTVSDTLAAEYRDYVTIKRTTPTSVEIFNPPLSSTLSSSSTSSLVKDEVLSLCDDPIVDDSNYNARVEFGLKLGYTESQVQMALVKVGPFAAQNELLEELIKLGASGPNLTKTNSNPSYTVVNNSSANHESHQHSHHHLVHHTDDVHLDTLHRTCDTTDSSDYLRPIVIDGSNVAMSHGNKEIFSCRGLRICVDWFKARGHKEITVFVPMWRKESSPIENPIKDREILFQLQNEKVLVFTPSRMVGGRRLTCHDDLYILNLASQNDGVVVSNDNYRDLINRNPEYKKVVEERLLMYSFVNDRFMPPDDPLGRHGPTLDVFLRRKEQPPPPLHCPYGKKCTYGNKCKYYHPERGNQPQKTVTERLLEQAQLQLMEVKARNQSGSNAGSSSSIDGVTSSTKLGEKMRATHTGSLPPNITLCEGNNGNKLGKKMTISRIKPLLTSHSTSFPLDARKDGLFNSQTIQQSIGSSNTGQIGNNINNNNNNNNNNVNSKVSSSKEAESVNLHRKLQRQLTLNPTYDARLARMTGYSDKSTSNKSRTPEKKGSSSSPGNSGGPAGGHKQVMRIRSDSGFSTGRDTSGNVNSGHKKTNHGALQNYPYLNLNSMPHPNVTRIASAPDSNSTWLPPRQTILGNANSDSRLNMCQNISIGSGLSQQQQVQSTESSVISSATPPFPGSSIWSTSESIPYQLAQPNWSNSPINLRPLSVPQFLPLSAKKSCPLLNSNRSHQGSQKTLMYRSLSPELFSDNPRSKLYFHLASIFPENHVRTAMDMLPGETNAQIICAAILNMFTSESPHNRNSIN